MDKRADDDRDCKGFIQNPPRAILSIFVDIYLPKTKANGQMKERGIKCYAKKELKELG